MLEKVIELLQEINPEVDYNTETGLIDKHLLDSLSILSLVAEIEEEFDVVIPTVEIIPANFNSAESLANLIKRLEEDE